MAIFVDGKKKAMRHRGTVLSLLKKINVRREEVVVKLNGRLAPETSTVGLKDRVEVIKVVFGG